MNNIDFKSSSYEEVLVYAKREPTVRTLGGRAVFKLRDVGGRLVIQNSRKKDYFIEKELWNTVAYRVNSLDIVDRNRTGSYTDPLWSPCPNRVASPYIAAIIKTMFLANAEDS